MKRISLIQISSIYYKEMSEPYILPLVFHVILNPALFSHSSYPPRYIKAQFYKFFPSYCLTSVYLSIINIENVIVHDTHEQCFQSKEIFINYGINHLGKHQLWEDDLSLGTEIVLISFENWYIHVQTIDNRQLQLYVDQ